MGSLARSQPGETTLLPDVSQPQHPNSLAETQVEGQPSHEKEMIAILDELEAIEAIDPVAKQQLMADLREAKQENWPLIVQQFKQALAYRQQLVAKEKKQLENSESQEEFASKSAPPAPPKQQTQAVAKVGAPSDPPPSVAAPTVKESTAPQVQAAMVTDLPPHPYPTTNSATAMRTEQVNYVTSQASELTTWQGHLEQAIALMEQQSSDVPRSTDEVHQQMRLRLLRLMAGREEEALQPISGAPTAMQDYWSTQLFALSTFLDNQRQPDDKSRAAGSLMHIDQARANLAELAVLQVRNLTFVESVEGYGVYQRLENPKFKPGDQANLYTEIENFRSNSTKEGYQTKIGTSYEVVDLNGQRVDGNAFQDVTDLCQNVRRDFHMQYGINLPTRIYPGKYELRLIITDQQSHKIGQARVPFEIVE